MLEIKADGQAESKLLELLLFPPGAQVSLAGASSAATQQQMKEMNYVIQTQQQQLDQAQSTIAEYQQAMMALAAQSSQPRRLPASPTESKATALGETPRRYITGGWSQSKTITAQTQTAPFFDRPHRLSLLVMVWSRRLAKPSLVLMLFCLVSWVVFRYVAPSIGAQLQTTTTVPTPALAPAPKQESEPPKPQSNLDQPSTPGSAASKAGTQPNALDL
ncbi:MAG: hypothetical protein DCF15_20870 [Phormidesmis priestleyi]|uniref:Uncharacterized protein n=1 Tax=Phormidesmis priestleyi TaxID=268141 RepID=A0A2W4WLL6_9CYAN|nr:MAG: hypothetical protein DCF15_20870 [Phormidesmis priestleyi]